MIKRIGQNISAKIIQKTFGYKVSGKLPVFMNIILIRFVLVKNSTIYEFYFNFDYCRHYFIQLQRI